MGIDQELTERIRRLVALDPRVTEKRMFGGICFLLDGMILVAARRTGTLMAQVGAECLAASADEPGVAPMMMRGKPTAAFAEISFDHVETDDDLQRWIDLAARYLATKPRRS